MLFWYGTPPLRYCRTQSKQTDGVPKGPATRRAFGRCAGTRKEGGRTCGETGNRHEEAEPGRGMCAPRDEEPRAVQGGWAVILGDGCYDAFLNDDVRWVARRLYATTMSLPPHALQAGVQGTSTDGRPSSPPASTSLGGDVILMGGGDATDPRLLTATTMDLALDVVQYAHTLTREAESVGFDRGTVVFPDRETAEWALRMDHSRVAVSADVVRCLSRSLDTRVLRDILWVGQRHNLVTRVVASLDADMVRIPTGCGHELFCASLPLGTVLKTWVYLRERRVAARATIVRWHWEAVSPGLLRQRGGRGVLMRWVPLAMTGGVVEVSMLGGGGDGDGVECNGARVEPWPWWIDRNVKIVDDVPSPEISCFVWKRKRAEPSVPEAPPPHAAPAPAPLVPSGTVTVGVSKFQQKVLDRWERSSKARGVTSCRLRRSIVSSVAVGVSSFGKGKMAICRGRCEREDVGRIFADNFGRKYTEEVMRHADEDDRIGIFQVHADDGRSLGAVSLVLFECTLATGEESVALLVDTFAVERSEQGRGVGGSVFHDFCRALAERHLATMTTLPKPRRYVVFAQCVRKGDAGVFWLDKLDSTSEARCLMLQAYALGHIVVQTESQCEARARVYETTA